MNPDNRLIILYGLLDAEYLAESSGNDAEIDRMILTYRGRRVHQSVISPRISIAR